MATLAQTSFKTFPTSRVHRRRVRVLISAKSLKAGNHLLFKRGRRVFVLASLVNKGHTSSDLHKIDDMLDRSKEVVAKVAEVRINRLLVGLKPGG